MLQLEIMQDVKSALRQYFHDYDNQLCLHYGPHPSQAPSEHRSPFDKGTYAIPPLPRPLFGTGLVTKLGQAGRIIGRVTVCDDRRIPSYGDWGCPREILF